ncbi:MAG: hypothetical protein R2705_23000 [Ilumatobacteraceae bacterium]
MGQVLGVDPRLIERLLSDHATLLRRLAPQQREASIAIRREEITALSDLLGEPPAEVIDRLGNLIGADHEQRATMFKLFAAGALVIGLAATGMVYGRGRAASGAGDAPLKALAPTEIVEGDRDPDPRRAAGGRRARRQESRASPPRRHLRPAVASRPLPAPPSGA